MEISEAYSNIRILPPTSIDSFKVSLFLFKNSPKPITKKQNQNEEPDKSNLQRVFSEGQMGFLQIAKGYLPLKASKNAADGLNDQEKLDLNDRNRLFEHLVSRKTDIYGNQLAQAEQEHNLKLFCEENKVSMGDVLKIGKLKVYKSGAVKLEIRNEVYEVRPGIDTKSKQQLVGIDNSNKTIHFCGDVSNKLVLTKET